jgi:HEAT repeat protein/beta-lactamase regulating signal transducer with metallopeptidase domain
MSGVTHALSNTVANAPWPFLLDIFFKSAVVLVAAFAASMLLRRSSASVRHQIWSMALASILVLPLLAAAIPAWQLPLSPRVPVVDDLLAELTQQTDLVPESVPDRGVEPQIEPRPQAEPEPQVEPRPQVEPEPRVEPRPQVGSEPQVEPRSQAGPEPRAEPTADMLPNLEPMESSEQEPTSTVLGVTSGSDGRGPGAGTLTLGFWLFIIWISVAALLLGRLLIGAFVASWITRTAEEVEDPSWKRLARRLARQLGIPNDVALVRNERTGMPMAWGLFRPVVLLPSDSKTWSAQRRRVVLLHELAHLKRHDCQTQILAQIACAVHWFNPLVWQAARRLRAEREQACDDLVLASGTKGTDYAQHLLEIARSMRAVDHAAWAAVSMAKPSQMEGRLMAILDSDRDRRSLTRVTSLSAVLLVAALILPLAALQPWAEAEEAAAGPGGQVLTQQEQFELQERITAQMEHQLQVKLQEQLELQLQELHISQFDKQFELQLQHQLQEQLSHQMQGLELNEAAIEGLMAGAEGLKIPAAALRNMVRGAGIAPPAHQASEKIVQAMIGALDDEDAEMREQAANSLGQLEDPRAVEPLTAVLLNDVEPSVREQAAWALGMIEDAAAVPALGQALTDIEADVREQAAWALGMIEDESAVDALAQVMNDPDEDVREQAVWALGMIEAEAAVAPLMVALNDSNAETRGQAAWALGMIEAPAAVDALSGALHDEDADVREQAAWALGMIEDAGAVSALATALNDSEASVREQAAWSLGMIEDPAGVDPLAALLAGDSDADVREQAAWALGMIEDERALDALLDALENDTQKDVREMALWAIGQVSDDVWEEDLDSAGGIG